MIVEWQRNTNDQTEGAKIHYPRFEAWQPVNPVDDRWLLTIQWSATDQEPIKVRELPDPEAVEEFVAGFLTGLANYRDENLSITIHFSARKAQTPREAKILMCLAKSVTYVP